MFSKSVSAVLPPEAMSQSCSSGSIAAAKATPCPTSSGTVLPVASRLCAGGGGGGGDCAWYCVAGDTYDGSHGRAFRAPQPQVALRVDGEQVVVDLGASRQLAAEEAAPK
eukprot:scaffold94990_cov58-Phaeocystis_antarctica.AAC.5